MWPSKRKSSNSFNLARVEISGLSSKFDGITKAHENIGTPIGGKRNRKAVNYSLSRCNFKKIYADLAGHLVDLCELDYVALIDILGDIQTELFSRLHFGFLYWQFAGVSKSLVKTVDLVIRNQSNSNLN